jgi:VIT1/CCC1 family predicted Fe2+/Mn2+ transporter
LSAKDRLGAHLRDELGINQESRALPLQAAWISAVSFATFAVVPVAALFLAPQRYSIPVIAAVSLASLSALGALGAHLGGAPIRRSLIRVTIGGASAMAATAVIGRLFGVATG